MAASYQMLFELNAAMGGGFTSAFTQGSQQIENMKSKLDALNASGSTGDLLGGISSALAATGVIKGLESIYDSLQECVSAASEFESAMAGVQRTVGGSEDFISGLGESFKQLSTQMPITAEELAGIATTAGQLGIAQADVEQFTTVMAQLATTTDLTADDAATMLAQFANITGLTDYERLGSTVASLGDATATTASKVVQMSQGLAASATQAGMSETDILAISAAVGSLGIEAQAGSTAMSTLISTLYKSVETGDKLEQFASVAGMTADQFKQAWGEDAVSAMDAFIQGLNDTERNGKSAVVILDELGITNVRQTKAILGLASAGDLLSNTISQANAAWAENTALGEKAGIMYDTTEAKMTMMQNAANNVKIAIGDALTPMVSGFAEAMTGILEPIAEFVEANPALVQGITAFVGVLGAAAAVLAAYTAYTKLAAAANLLFAGSIPGIGLIVGVAAAIGGLVAGIGLLTAAYNDAHPSFEKLDAQFDELNEKAKEQQAIIDLAEEYQTLVKEIDELETQSTDTKITIDAVPGEKVSVSQDLVVDKDGNVYTIDAETGNIVSVAMELVTDKDGNTYVIDAEAGQKVSVKGELVTDKSGLTYVVDAQSGRHVSVRDDLVVDKDGNVFMIDAVTGNKVSVKYDLVTEADGTQYIINAETGHKVKVNTDLVYGNSEDELKQVINAEAGTHVSVSGELVIDKEGNTYVINARTGEKVSVKADLVTDKDGTVYMIDAEAGKKVSVSDQLVVDKDGQLVPISGEVGDTVSVYSLITDEEGKNVTITATVDTEGAAGELEALTEAEAESSAAAEELAAKRERLREVTEALRAASGGLITATDQETESLTRQVEAYEAVAKARKDQYTSEALDTVKKMSKQYVQSISAEQAATEGLNRAQAQQTAVQEFIRSGDAAGYVRSEYESLCEAVNDYYSTHDEWSHNWANDDNEEAQALQERFRNIQDIINLLSGSDHWFAEGDLTNMAYAIETENFSIERMTDSWQGAIEEANKYADAVEANDAIQQEYLQNLINGVAEGTLEYEDLQTALEEAFKDYENGGELVEQTMKQVEEGVNAAKAAAEGSGEVAQTESQGSIEAVSNVITKVEELRQAYEAAKAAAKESLDGKFGLFDQAGLSDERQSVEEMGQGLQSQTEYWNLYNDNLQAVLDKGLAPEIAKQLADGSQSSAEALASLAEASEEEIQSINEAFAEVEASKDALASTIADMQTNFSTTLATMKADLDAAVAELDKSSEAATAAAATMTAYVEGLNAEDENASTAAQSIAANVNAALSAITDVDVDITYHYKTEGSPPSDAGGTVEGHNAIGSDYAAEGLHLVGEEGPELVYMGGGEKILTAHETVNALSGSGGSNVISVNFSPSYNVSGSQNASELRSVLEEQTQNLRDQITEIMEDIVTDKMRVAYG
nr:phage tail tape measure protein [Clostridia bacterium]